jgi:hypothetical protein
MSDAVETDWGPRHMPPETVETDWARCEHCDKPYQPYKRRRSAQRFCSASCRARDYDRTHPRIPYQTDIFGLVEGRPAPPRRPRRRRKRRTAKAEAVLARLREGPANTLELLRVGGVRFGARVHELRAEGHRITTEPQGDHAVYRLEA